MKLPIPRDDLTSVLRQTLLACSPTAGEVNQMKLFTSLATIALSLGEREEGQSLASEIVALALLVFAFFGALFLFKTIT
jgi:hypothetical protein